MGRGRGGGRVVHAEGGSRKQVGKRATVSSPSVMCHSVTLTWESTHGHVLPVYEATFSISR